jgi:hypothetical protein
MKLCPANGTVCHSKSNPREDGQITSFAARLMEL